MTVEDKQTEVTRRFSFATRSLVPELTRISDSFLDWERNKEKTEFTIDRHKFSGTDACSYFRELLTIKADWVVNVDEDAFLLDHQELYRLIRFMDSSGFAACGMSDGGTVSIRKHNPVACNAFFNVFDMRRVRKVWSDWPVALKSPFRPEFKNSIPEFARKTEAAFDDFEPYYGLFFALLENEEPILYLPARDWPDGISTLLLSPSNAPLVLHAWYAREWNDDPQTRKRIVELADDARMYRSRLFEQPGLP